MTSFNHQYNQFYNEGVSKHEMIGNLDEIAFYNTVLEDIDVNTNSKKFIPIDFENLVAYYQCNESFGNNVFDISKTIDVFNENVENEKEHAHLMNMSIKMGGGLGSWGEGGLSKNYLILS